MSDGNDGRDDEPTEGELVTLQEAAARAGRTTRTIRRWVDEGLLRAWKLRTRSALLVREGELDDLLRPRPYRPGGTADVVGESATDVAAETVAAEVLALLTSGRAAPIEVRGARSDSVVFASDVRTAVERGLRAARAVGGTRPGRTTSGRLRRVR